MNNDAGLIFILKIILEYLILEYFLNWTLIWVVEDKNVAGFCILLIQEVLLFVSFALILHLSFSL